VSGEEEGYRGSEPAKTSTDDDDLARCFNMARLLLEGTRPLTCNLLSSSRLAFESVSTGGSMVLMLH